VANKFQTGFDQPLLCGMYVDKRLADIQAVQTLSRLNRAYPGKDTTYVIDFVNDPEEVLASFKTYHTTAELATTTDPELVLNLRAKLDAAGFYDDFEVERVVAVELNPKARQSDLVSALEPVLDRITKRYKSARQALLIKLTDQDKLVYVNNVIKGKLLESAKLIQQASNNTKEQFANSPDLKTELMNAIMGALDAHTLMSTQALNSPSIQSGMKDILLNNARLYESLRAQAAA
jgi:type I site-specific restriction-modification system R (restriction) subunit